MGKSKVISRFSSVEGLAPLAPELFKAQLHLQGCFKYSLVSAEKYCEELITAFFVLNVHSLIESTHTENNAKTIKFLIF